MSWSCNYRGPVQRIQSTACAHATINPTWRQSLLFPCAPSRHDWPLTAIHVTVWDRDRFLPDRLIGYVTVKLTGINIKNIILILIYLSIYLSIGAYRVGRIRRPHFLLYTLTSKYRFRRVSGRWRLHGRKGALVSTAHVPTGRLSPALEVGFVRRGRWTGDTVRR